MTIGQSESTAIIESWLQLQYLVTEDNLTTEAAEGNPQNLRAFCGELFLVAFPNLFGLYSINHGESCPTAIFETQSSLQKCSLNLISQYSDMIIDLIQDIDAIESLRRFINAGN